MSEQDFEIETFVNLLKIEGIGEEYMKKIIKR